MALQFKKATKEQSRLRMSIAGPSGSGKTYTSLKIATELGGRIAFIDTERGSAAKYANTFDFDVIELDDFHPDNFIEAMRVAEKAGYDILVIDSTTHEWQGKNGILQLHEAVVSRQKNKNDYAAWKDVMPLHDAFIDAILQNRCHIIATVRSDTEYVQEKNDQGKTEVKKIGMKSQQRKGMDYEYDVMMEMDIDHRGIVTKTRCEALDGKSYRKPGAELANILKEWLSSGASPSTRAAQSTESDDADKALKSIYLEMGKTESEWNTLYADTIKGLDLDAKKKKLTAWQEAALDRKAKAEAQSKENILLTQIEEGFTALTELGVSKAEQDKLVTSVTLGAPLDECDDAILKSVVMAMVAAINEVKA